jgi:hypothetical protein
MRHDDDFIDRAIDAQASPIAAARTLMKYPAERRQDIIDKLRTDGNRADRRRRRLHRYVIIAAHKEEITIND